MADVEFGVKQPDVRFDAGATPVDRVVERDPPPVVIVRMAGDGQHVASGVGWVMCKPGSLVPGLAPVRHEIVISFEVPEQPRAPDEHLENVEDATARKSVGGKFRRERGRRRDIQEQQREHREAENEPSHDTDDAHPPASSRLTLHRPPQNTARCLITEGCFIIKPAFPPPFGFVEERQ